MAKFNSPLADHAEFLKVREGLEKRKGPAILSGCIDSSKAYLVSEAGKSFDYQVVVTYNEVKAAEIASDLSCFLDEVLIYPSKDLLFYKADVKGALLTKKRMEILRKIFEGEKIAIVLSIESLLEKLAPNSKLASEVITIGNDSVVSITDLEKKLTRMGYERFPEVDASGQFAVRGGIIDIYPLAADDPVRIELFGDEVDSIRTFDLTTQRSISNIEEVTIFPGAEPKIDKLAVSFLEYLPENTLVVLDEPARLKEKAQASAHEFHESETMRTTAGYENKDVELFNVDSVFEEFNDKNVLALTGIDQKGAGIKYNIVAILDSQTVPSYLGHFETLVSDLKKWKKEKSRVILLAGSFSRAERLAGDLREEGITAICTKDEDAEAERGCVLVKEGNLKHGFGYSSIGFYVLSEGDLFGKKKRRKRKASSYEGQKITELSTLGIGDYVIHENHGLGIYGGTISIERNGAIRDFIKITYGDGGVLYTPVTQMDIVQKYADANADKKPKLNRLNSMAWTETKKRVKTAVREIAKDLIKLYSARLHGKGYAYEPDTVWQKEFEEQFAFEETEDQLKAIEETKADMESDKIMDRLICGDVGFGKTEIAIRAAFKAVQENKQVAYLVPTTILAQQHYNTFVQRLKDYGPNIELLSRFKTAGQQKKIIENLKKGNVDIVIGTHRLLSKDVQFKDLGLLVIDEEQRFGVSDKEKIKQLKESVDVLSLTATPIPRTLHMSMIGIRDMSLLREAPLDRVPIQTYVMEYNDEFVREAISRELARGGQVYYVYNKVVSIAERANHIRNLVPDANVAFAHGKMRESELERIMLDFINGDIDVLVSTTIVETGLDISNVNTILIHDADKFGLSQLYQLRGRVGRSNRIAYAFLFYKKDKQLKEIAEKRLSTIREYTELGSGIKIAMRDLELRGAGNILGAEQHGHMEAVGYELYCKMLGEAVSEEKGEKKVTEDFETEIDIIIDANLPDTYIKDESQRLSMYRRIAGIESEEEFMDVQDELIDRFGEIPLGAQNLLRIALIKRNAHEAYITEISGNRDEFKISLFNGAPLDPTRIADILAKYRGDLRVSIYGDTSFTYVDNQRRNTSPPRFLETITEIISDIESLKISEERND